MSCCLVPDNLLHAQDDLFFARNESLYAEDGM
jgi:hypothetical protein